MEAMKMEIAKWTVGDEHPVVIKTEVIHDWDGRRRMMEAFRKMANEMIMRGWHLYHITHLWNYNFRKDGEHNVTLYMYEDSL